MQRCKQVAIPVSQSRMSGPQKPRVTSAKGNIVAEKTPKRLLHNYSAPQREMARQGDSRAYSRASHRFVDDRNLVRGCLGSRGGK